MRTMITGLAAAIILASLGGGTGPILADPATEPATPTTFSGLVREDCHEATWGGLDEVRNVQQARGWGCTYTIIEMSDPRMDGTGMLAGNTDRHLGEVVSGAVDIQLWTVSFRIETDEGAWQAVPTTIYVTDHWLAVPPSLLIGEGSYEGLTAFWYRAQGTEAGTADVWGAIVVGDPPPVPELSDE